MRCGRGRPRSHPPPTQRALRPQQAIQLGKLTAALAIALGGLACVPAGTVRRPDRQGRSDDRRDDRKRPCRAAHRGKFRRPGLADLRADHRLGHRHRPELGAVLGADRRRLAAASCRQPAHLPDGDRICADDLHRAGDAGGRVLEHFRDSTSYGIPTSDTIEQFRISIRLVWQQFPRSRPYPAREVLRLPPPLRSLCVRGLPTRSRAGRSDGPRLLFRPASCSSSRRRSASTATAFRSPRCGWGWDLHDRRAVHGSRTGRFGMDGKRRQSLWSALPARSLRVVCDDRCRRRCTELPGAGDKALLDTRNRDGDVTEVVSPLVDIRSRLVNRGNVELLTVATDDAPIPGSDGARQVRRFPWSTLRRRPPRPADGTLGEAPPQRRAPAAADHDQKARRVLAPAARTATSAQWQGSHPVVGGRSRGAVRRRRA